MINFGVDPKVSFAFSPHLQQTEMKEVYWFLRIKLLLNTVGIRKSTPKNVFYVSQAARPDIISLKEHFTDRLCQSEVALENQLNIPKKKKLQETCEVFSVHISIAQEKDLTHKFSICISILLFIEFTNILRDAKKRETIKFF